MEYYRPAGEYIPGGIAGIAGNGENGDWWLVIGDWWLVIGDW
jgi:hypothetical protein